MNKIIPALLAVVAAGAALGYFLLKADPADIAQSANPEVHPDEPVAIAEAADSAVRPPPLAAEDRDTEMVMGIRVRKDRNCTVKRHYIDHGNGMVSEAFSCVPNMVDDDPYERYTTAELSVLAYGDAEAAAELGKRLVATNEAASRSYMLRAVALDTDDLQPLYWLASQTASLRGDSPEARRAVADSFILLHTARAFDESVPTRWIDVELEEYGFTDEERDRLNDTVVGNLEYIHSVQLEVFGGSPSGGEL